LAIRISAQKSTGLGEPKTAFANDRPPISFDLKHGLGDDKRRKKRNWKETPEQEGSKKNGAGGRVGQLMKGGQIISYLSAHLQWDSTESQIGN